MYKCKWECKHTEKYNCCQNCEEACCGCLSNPENCENSIECIDEEE